MSPEEKQQGDWWGKFFGKIITSIIVLPIIMWIWPDVVPFGFFQLWKVEGTMSQWLISSWPIFVWGAGVTLVHGFFTRNERHINRNAELIIKEGAIVSIIAGVGEEITFRWLFFLDNIVSVKIANWFFFGFIGFGIPAWFHMYIVGPIANWFTLGELESFIFHSTGWAVGAAMLTTNAFFRDGHRYLGFLGFVNSWFLGMFLFWIMFKYGLLAAILIHFTYDFLIYLVHYVDSAIERAMGYA
ncbi:MAG: hypothetical protein WC095_02555 [Candidatus Paceibacterota bacterium]